MKTAGRFLMMILVLIFLCSFNFTTPGFSAQMMRNTQGTTAGPTATKASPKRVNLPPVVRMKKRTVRPAATKISPKRVKALHKATPKSLLVVKRITISPAHPRVGDKVAIQVQVANNGPKGVKNVKVDIYLGKKVVAWQMYNIKARGSQDYVGYFTKTQAPKAGTYTVSALIDPNKTLERTFYKCNSAALKITLLPSLVRKRPETVVNKRKTVPKSKTRRAAVRPGRPGNNGTPPSHAEMKPSKATPGRPMTSVSPGHITHVTVKVLSSSPVRNTKTRQFGNTLEVRWDRKGILPPRVDIFLHPYRRSGKEVCLRRNVSNNGRVKLPLPGKINSKQTYLVRVQTHGGKVYGDSKSFHIIPSTVALTTQKGWKANTAAKTGRSAKLKVNHPASLVHLDPSAGPPHPIQPALQATKSLHVAPKGNGMGPNRIAAGAVSSQAIRQGMPLGKMVTYEGATFQITAPKAGASWIYGPTYPITMTWTPASATVKIQSITLMDALHQGKAVTTIYPSPAAVLFQLDHTIGTSFKVPQSIKEGKYFLKCAFIDGAGKGKNTIIATSGVFDIAFAVIGKALPFKDIIADAMPELLNYAKNMPMITYFDYNKTLKECEGLRVSFYWKDGEKNLFRGDWTLEWKTSKGWKHKTSPISYLSSAEDFTGSHGFNKFTIPFCEPKDTTPFRFFLTDAAGIKSNVVTGIIRAPGTPTAPSPTHLADPIEFIAPKGMRTYVKGTKIDIQIALNAAMRAKKPPIRIELIPEKGEAKVIYNNPIPKNGHISWTIPKSIPEGLPYFFKATSSLNPYETAKSTYFGLVNKGLEITSPKAGSHYTIGDTITLNWKTVGIAGTESMDIYIFPPRSNTIYLKLNKNPVPIKNGTWSWKAKSGIVPAGLCSLQFGSTSQGKYLIGMIPINIVYPKNTTPPSLIFKKPEQLQTATWLAGTSQSTAWEPSGYFSELTKATIILENMEPKKGGSLPIGKITIPEGMNLGSHVTKSQIKIPENISPGPYRMMVFNSTGIIGKSPVFEIVNPGADMLPAPGTTFTIQGVMYYTSNMVSVAVKVYAPKAFRLGTHTNAKRATNFFGAQSISYTITNYGYKTLPETAAISFVTNQANPNIFPTKLFPKGYSFYQVFFEPELLKPVRALETRKNGKTCCVYRPKIEISLSTFTKGAAQAINTTWKSYITGSQRKIINVQNTACQGDVKW